jgi:MoxR-like ATPase
MPADITGTEVIEEDRDRRARASASSPGPIFTNVLLADEINRTPPKTQAALLEAMQERQVTVGRATPAPQPVLRPRHPEPHRAGGHLPPARGPARPLHAPRWGTVLDRSLLLGLQSLVRRLPANEAVTRYAVRLARATRPGPDAPEATRRYVQWGAGPRASQHLAVGARVWAALHGNEVPSIDDVAAVAAAVLSHRVLLNFQAEAQGVTPSQVIAEILRGVPRS